MIDLPAILIEPGIGYWRSSQIDEDGFPQNLTIHDDVRFGQVGSIYPAIVKNLDTNSDIAFLSLGKAQGDSPMTGVMNLRRAKQLVKGQVTSISDCLYEGQKLMVQVLSEPSSLENKSVSVTAKPRLDGRYVSVELGSSRLNFSKDLGPKTIKSLKQPLSELADSVALIVRARAATVPAHNVLEEAKWLIKAITTKVNFAFSPIEKTLISLPDGDDPIYVDGGSEFAKVRTLIQQKWPDLNDKIRFYNDQVSAFEEFGIEDAIEEALGERIHLPSGGWISIHETPALTAIDVNMGGALREMSAAQAKLTVNMEAALAVAHHIRFQDIGGLIIVDFIDMSGKGTAAKLLELFDKALKDDPVPVRRSGISAFGLVEMSRQRKGLSLKDRYHVQRSASNRASEVAFRLLRKALKLGRSAQPGDLIIQCEQAVESWFHHNPDALKELQNMIHRSIHLNSGAEDVFVQEKI